MKDSKKCNLVINMYYIDVSNCELTEGTCIYAVVEIKLLGRYLCYH